MKDAVKKCEGGNGNRYRPRLEVLEARWCLSLAASEYQANTTVAQDQAESANASSASGTHVVVWTDHSAGNANIQAQRYGANGQRLGGEITVTVTDQDEHEPAVAMDADGNFVVVWTVDTAPDDQDVLGARFAADGTPIDTFAVFDGGPTAYDPSVAMTPGGAFLVSASWQALSSYDIAYSIFNADGDELFTDVIGSDFGDVHSSAAASASGFAIAFDDSNGSIHLLQLGSFLSVISFQELPSPPASHPSVAMDSDGDVVVAYVANVALDFTKIATQRVSHTGALGDYVELQNTGGFFVDPAVALDPMNGKFVVAYYEEDPGDLGYHPPIDPPVGEEPGYAAPGVHVREVSASGVVGVDQSLGAGRSDPAVSIGGDHRYLVTYTKEDGEVLWKANPPLDAPSGTGVFTRFGTLGAQRPLPLKPPTQIYFNEGVLKILGNASDNKVEVAGYGDNIAITADGTDRGVYSNVRRVDVKLSDGGDNFTAFLPYIEQTLLLNIATAAGADVVHADIGLVAGALGLNINLGGGNDACELTHSAGFAEGGQWNVKLAAGAGDDAVRFLAPIPAVPAVIQSPENASFRGNFDLGGGNDINEWDWDMPVDVLHDVVIRGGPGNDTDTERWADISAQVSHRWEGNDGNDTQLLTLTSTGAEGPPAVIGGSLALTSDGGAGNNTTALHLDRVTVAGPLSASQKNAVNRVVTHDAVAFQAATTLNQEGVGNAFVVVGSQVAVNAPLTLTQSGITNTFIVNWSVAPEVELQTTQIAAPGGANSIIAILNAAAGSLVELIQRGSDCHLELNAVADGSLLARQFGTEGDDRLSNDSTLLGAGTVDLLMAAYGGDDDLTFHVGRFGKFLSFKAEGDGMDGYDVARGSLNVEFLNCEEVYLPE